MKSVCKSYLAIHNIPVPMKNGTLHGTQLCMGDGHKWMVVRIGLSFARTALG